MAEFTTLRSTRHASESRIGAFPAVCLAVLAIPAVFAAIALKPLNDDDGRERAIKRRATADGQARSIQALALDTRLMPVSREEALRLNALRPADLADVAAARPFIVAEQFRDDPRFRLAADCLTQAVYYEAGSESDAGERAVAQVVLNRVRHPAFPNTVCGVVYQGASRPTGCQFTFTCDGSLARQPSASGWRRARRVALAALSGWVEARVGTSTHYHASYVLPYWAGSLDKVLTVGLHSFYAMRGASGARGSFVARYDMAGEFIPPLPDAVPLLAEDLGGEAAAAVLAAGETTPGAVRVAEDEIAAHGAPLADDGRLRERSQGRLRADENRGELVPGSGSGLLVD